MDKTLEQGILELEQELIFSKNEQAKLAHELTQTNEMLIIPKKISYYHQFSSQIKETQNPSYLALITHAYSNKIIGYLSV